MVTEGDADAPPGYPGHGGSIVELVPNAVYLLCDAVARFPESVEAAFPGLASSQHARAVKPSRATPWVLHSHCYLVVTEQHAVLVDTGVGPRGGPAGTWLTVDGRLPLLLDKIEVDVGAIDLVLLTHLHLDHVGWNLAPGSASPLFPRAEYVVQTAELDHVRDASKGAMGSTYELLVAPIELAGQLTSIDGARQITAEIEALPSPGHTPGHQSVRVRLGRSEYLLAGDAFVHPLQVEDPNLAYVYGWDARAAARSRGRLLTDARRVGALLAPAHFPEPLELYASGPAQPDDAGAVDALVHAAYEHYVDRIGVTPRPMQDDYVTVIHEHEVTVARSGEAIAGVLVLAVDDRATVLTDPAARLGAGPAPSTLTAP